MTNTPTEQGWYLTKAGEAVYRASDGYWTLPDRYGVTDAEMAVYGPFTRLASGNDQWQHMGYVSNDQSPVIADRIDSALADLIKARSQEWTLGMLERELNKIPAPTRVPPVGKLTTGTITPGQIWQHKTKTMATRVRIVRENLAAYGTRVDNWSVERLDAPGVRFVISGSYLRANYWLEQR